MSKETVRKAIVDGEGSNLVASVVQSVSDPTKYGLVVCKPDGSDIGGFTGLNNGQATTWNGGTTAVDLGGLFDVDIAIGSTNSSGFYIGSSNGSDDEMNFMLRTAAYSPSYFNQRRFDYTYSDWNVSEVGADITNTYTYMQYDGFDFLTDGRERSALQVNPNGVKITRYPNTRDDADAYHPENWLYTDRDGQIKSAPMYRILDYVGIPATFTVGTLTATSIATGTMTSSGLYTANAGITVATGNLTISNGNITAIATNTIVESLTQSLTGSSDRSIISAATTWNTTGIPTAWYLNVTDTASNANSLLIDLQRGGVSQFKVNKFGQGTINQMTIGSLSMSSNSIIPSINGYVLLNTGRTWFFANSSASNTYLRINESSSTATSGAMSPVVASMGFAPTSGTATMTSFLVNSVINQTGGANGIVRGVYVNPTLTAAADFRAISTNVASGTGRRAMSHEGTASTFQAGKETFDATNTAAGTTGDQTINKPSGTVNFATAATTLVVTNSMCVANSIVYAVVRTNDATAVIKNVVPAAGSFTINLSAAATAETSVGFIVYN